MTRFVRLATAVAMAAAGLLAAPTPAQADHDPPGDFATTRNLHFLGLSPFGNTITPFTANSDLAFWGRRAFQGHYDGFRILDVSSPARPRQVFFQECFDNQGDIVVWDDILVRSWNSPAPAGATCDGQPVAEGFEGLHVFDISDLRNPELVASVELECGSHTATVARLTAATTA